MEYIKYLDYAEQEVGIAILNKPAKFGIVVAGPASDAIVKYMESGSSMLPPIKMKKAERIFSFGSNTDVDWKETLDSLEDYEVGLSEEASEREVLSIILKIKRSVITSIFRVE